MKKQSGAAALQNLVEKTQSLTKNSNSSADDRFWEPTTDKTGSGYATLRFLPAPPGEDFPFIRYFRHAFKGPKTLKWYINNSLTSIGKEDPVGEYNRQLWATGLEENKAFVRAYTKRKMFYVSNVFIIDDPANPDNNGKVMLLRYGAKIMAKIQLAMGLDEKGEPVQGIADEDLLNAFDLYEGADFNFKIRKVDGYNNYDMSSFGSKKPLLEGDDGVLEEIWKKEYSLFQFVDPEDTKTYPTYDTLYKRLVEVLDLEGTAVVETAAKQAEPESTHEELMAKFNTAESPVIEESEASESPVVEDDDDDDEDTMAFFNKLKDE
jgi:hypothetical protein